MDEKHNCSLHSDKLCCHSAESILLVLSKSPWPHTIKEISDLTNLHRNTIRQSLKNLNLQSLGLKNPADKNKKQYGIEQYFFESISEHYRTLVYTMSELADNKDDTHKKMMAKKLGYNLVKTRLDSIFKKLDDIGITRSRHLNLEHAFLHLKIAYPFTDLDLDEDNQLVYGTKFQVKSGQHDLLKNKFELKLNPCLCNGDPGLACFMVEGALEGIIKLVIDKDSEVRGILSGSDEDGQYCIYEITTFETDSQLHAIEKDDTLLNLSQHNYQEI